MFLCLISVVEVFSATSTIAYKNANHWAPIVRHATFLLGGFVLVLLLHNVPCRFFPAFILLLPVSVLMLLVTPFVGINANDAHRWLEIFGIQFQPSEFAKLASIVFIAFLLSKRSRFTDDQIFKYILIGVGVTCVLILPENFSTAFMLFGVCFLMMFIGQVPLMKLGKLAGVLILALILFIVLLRFTPAGVTQYLPDRFSTWQGRLERFFDGHESDTDENGVYKITDDNYQVSHAKIAIARGGVFGQLPGHGQQRDFLPQAYSDFIYAIIIEELGVVGGVFVLMLYIMLLVRVGMIARKCEKAFPKYLVLGCGLLIVVQALANMAATSIPTTSRTDYVADNQDVAAVTEPLKKTEFYRIDKTNARTKNDGAWMHFPSVSLFSSVANAGVTDFFKQMGCEGSTNAYSIVGSTPLVDSLFSIKYALYEGKQDNPRLSLYAFSGDTYLYENPWTLPLGFILPDIVETGWKRDLSSPADVQNDLSDVLGVPECLIFTDGEEQGNRFSFTAPEDGEYYISVANRQIDSVKLDVGGEDRSIDTLKRGYLVETGYVKAGTLILLESNDSAGSMDASAYRFDEAGLRALYERLNQHPFELETSGEEAMKGTIDAGEGGTLFLTIPYDEGWTVTVDGKEAITRPVWKAFTGVELTAGTHTVELRYYPQGLHEGLLISGGALFVLAVIVASMYIRKKKQGKTSAKMRKTVEKEPDGDLKLRN